MWRRVPSCATDSRRRSCSRSSRPLGKLAIPILIQVILDRGVLDSGGFRAEFVLLACLGAVAITIGVLFISRIAYFRLVRAAEQALCNLRVRVFDHIHQLSMAEHTTTRRGVFVSRVTSDIETLARFVQWGMISWLVNGTLIVGTLIVMLVYSWQLTLLVLVAYAPVLPLFRAFQRRQLQAYDEERTRIGDMIAEFSETVTGAAVIRAYGLQERARVRLRERIDSAYRARVRAAKYFAAMFPLGDFFGAIATAAVVVAAAYYGTEWGLDVGKVVAFMFLINLLLSPIGELSEILDQTQTAISGWRKVLAVLDVPIDVAEPADGVHLAHGALAVEVSHIGFAYRGDAPVLHDVSVDIAAGTHVAVVGETGSGKTTFAKLLCRLADPTEGRRAHRRLRPPRRRPRFPPARDPHGAAGRLPVRHDDRRQRAHGRPGRDRRRHRTRVRPPRARLVVDAPARRPRDGGRRAR